MVVVEEVVEEEQEEVVEELEEEKKKEVRKQFELSFVSKHLNCLLPPTGSSAGSFS